MVVTTKAMLAMFVHQMQARSDLLRAPQRGCQETSHSSRYMFPPTSPHPPPSSRWWGHPSQSWAVRRETGRVLLRTTSHTQTHALHGYTPTWHTHVHSHAHLIGIGTLKAVNGLHYVFCSCVSFLLFLAFIHNSCLKAHKGHSPTHADRQTHTHTHIQYIRAWEAISIKVCMKE